MANENTKTQQSDATVSEKEAFESSGPRKGKLKAGYEYNYRTVRDENGNPKTVRTIAKVGK